MVASPLRILPVLSVIGVVIALLVGVVFALWARLDRTIEEITDKLLTASEEPSEQTFRTRDLANLPAPIRRYLGHVLRNGQPYVQTVRLWQRGTFRSGGAHSPWSSFTATQHVTTRPPGFVWDATIALFPWISVRAVDEYREGRGDLWARLGGIVPVANSVPSPELDEGELMRYLAEAPLYPTALLPGMGVTWTPINDQSARATLEHRGTTASLVFYVNDQNEVERVLGRRGFTTEDGTYEYRPWKGYWRNYQRRAGMRVPIDGEVAWLRPEGEVSYWRGHMEKIEYHPAPRNQRENPNAPRSPNRSSRTVIADPDCPLFRPCRSMSVDPERRGTLPVRARSWQRRRLLQIFPRRRGIPSARQEITRCSDVSRRHLFYSLP